MHDHSEIPRPSGRRAVATSAGSGQVSTRPHGGPVLIRRSWIRGVLVRPVVMAPAPADHVNDRAAA